MGTETFPKRGKKSTAPSSGRLGRKVVDQELGDPYRYRHSMGGDQVRMRELYDNDYGKDAAPVPERGGVPVSPRKTIITAS